RGLVNALRFKRDTSTQQRWSALEYLLHTFDIYTGDIHCLLAELLNVDIPDDFPAPTLTPQARRKRTLEALVDLVAALGRAGPVMFVIEDLQWADPTTLEFVERLRDSVAALPILIVLTFRSDYEPRLRGCPSESTVSLERLGAEDARALIDRVTGDKALPRDVVEQILARGEGVPLYLEEITKAVLDLDMVVDSGERYELREPIPPDHIPGTLRSSLTARLDRLEGAKSIAQLAATIGREFRLDLLCAVATIQPEAVQSGLQRLLEAQLIYPLDEAPDLTYVFKHALIQDAAYQSQLRNTRRKQHLRIAETLEVSFEEIASQRPELLAQHFASGGGARKAVTYWIRAGHYAFERAANYESISHVENALAMLDSIEQSRERDGLELECYKTLTPALQTARGWAAPEVDQAFQRSAALLARFPESPDRLRFLSSSTAFHVMRGNIATALAQSHELHEITKETNSPGLQVVAFGLSAVAKLYSGAISEAVQDGESGLSLLTPALNASLARRSGLAPEVNISCYLAEAWWTLGFPERALEFADRAISSAESINHQPSREFAVGYQTLVYHMLRDPERILAAAERARELGSKRGSPFWSAVTATYAGWALCSQGRCEEGLVRMRDGIDRFVASGHGLSQVHMRVALAEGLGMAGELRAALAALDETLAVSAATGEVHYLPEVHRLRGDFLRRLGASGTSAEHAAYLAQADTAVREALELARRQGARSLELRAAISRFVLHSQRESEEIAQHELALAVASFSAGQHTPDLNEARAMLARTALD
ncbi:MAG: hypothetical protein RLW62_13430, partial [Gammaproteobacteria bacterium]